MDDSTWEDLWLEGWAADGNEDAGDGFTYDGDKVSEYDPSLDPTNW